MKIFECDDPTEEVLKLGCFDIDPLWLIGLGGNGGRGAIIVPMIIGKTTGIIISALKEFNVFINSKFNSFNYLPRKCFRRFYTFSNHKLFHISIQQYHNHDNALDEHF